MSRQNSSYDYIITGAGCAGLSLLIHLIHSGRFTDKSILLLDQDLKKDNDRTWCFWEKEPGLFQSIVYKEWKQLQFFSKYLSKALDIKPYSYKLIRGIDFYSHCLSMIGRQTNIEFKQAKVQAIESNDKETYVIADGERYTASYIFNSILLEKPVLKANDYWLLQHFTGWIIETDQPVFNPSAAILMDFRTNQKEGTTFFYMLPFTDRKALVEYTIFSRKILSTEGYQQALEQYIEDQLQISQYQILEREFGVIPMTNFSFAKQQNKIINIGTAGGYTKGSSGYTFRFIQKSSAAITRGLHEKNNPMAYIKASKRFQFYDSVLLNILNGRKMAGDVIFTRLFQDNKATQVLSFLDNETSVPEDLNIIRTLPTMIFFKAAVEHISKGI